MATVQPSGTVNRSGTLHRSGTRRAPANAPQSTTNKKKTYEDAQQGIKEINTPKDKSIVPDIDIVFVPGLGANPDQSWESGKAPNFNWIKSEDGLRRDFPKARFLLYSYESAWVGALKVKQTIGNIADNLLAALSSVRKKPKRPLVFIGHSMGGLVIAKAISLADSRKDKYPRIFEAITGCVFFGTPFGGTAVAQAAALYAYLAEKAGAASASKLLTLMEEGNEELRDLVHDLMRLCTKIAPKIELFCFYEQEQTDFSKMAGLPSLFGWTKSAIPNKFADFVTRESAILQGVEHRGLACNHRNLVKFDGPKDDRWLQFVREPLKKVIQGAQLSAKNRFNASRDVEPAVLKSIKDALDGAEVHKKRRALTQTFAPSSWIPKEAEYTQWLAPAIANNDDDEDMNPKLTPGDCIWIRGREGRGKTNATMAVLQEIERQIQLNEEGHTGEDPILLAYFFCDTQPDYCTAEDILKSIILQLISQQESLAAYAKVFQKKKTPKPDSSKPQSEQAQQQVVTQQAKVTIENLWQALQDMLADEIIGSRVYFVLNNLHVLPPEADSTVKLMRFIEAEIQNIMAEEIRHVRTRWLITSRETHGIQQALNVDGVRLIDLEDSKYENQVQLELRKHARKKISALGTEKNYNKALAYFASSLIGKRAQNTQWIDITCVQLSVLAKEESDLRVRRVLERMPEDLNTLLNLSWQTLFEPNDSDVEKIQEMLRALVLTYEDPTESELEVLAGLASTDQDRAELRRLVEMCKPLLTIQRTSRDECTVSFLNVVVKTHLRKNAKQLLGLSEEETKWQHGVLALRCFSHLKESFDFPEPDYSAEADDAVAGNDEDGDEDDDGTEGETEENNENDSTNKSNSELQSEAGQDEGEAAGDEDQGHGQHDEDDDDAASQTASVESASSWESEDYDDEDEDEDTDPEVEMVRSKSLMYTVKHWLHHASKATLEIAEDLSLEHDFWMPDSKIRRRWLIAYCDSTTTFDDFDRTQLTGLHVAAAIGFRTLVEALIRNGHEGEIKQRDELFNSPLHFAAHLGRPGIVEELLNRGAPIDDAIEEREQTPLHMAAFGGHIEVMKKLIVRGANPNAWGAGIGPVVNAAISSGSRAAVELLVEHGVSLHMEGEYDSEDLSPLAHAACLSDPPMFLYLVQKYADKLPADEFSKALVTAAESGRLEVFNKLLEFKHQTEFYQKAINSAAEEENWDIVTILLEHCQGLDCDYVFHTAAVSSELQDKVLQAIWQHPTCRVSKEAIEKSLYEATDYEKDSTVKLLLQEFKVSPNATGPDYGNALTAAAYDANMKLLQLLIESGADVNSPDGWALQIAAAQGHYEIVEELIRHGADVNACTTHANFASGTALQGACEASRTDIVALLLEKGADPNLGTGPSSPPIVTAAKQGDCDILELLVKAKAEVNVFGGWDHSTPLINSTLYMPLSSHQLLLDAGADINLSDNDGDTALIVSAWRGDIDTLNFLLDNGADLLQVSSRDENALQGAIRCEQWSCVEILANRLSVLLTAIKNALDSGNPEVTKIVRSAVTSKQELDYDGDAPSDADTPGVETPQVETARAIQISSPTSTSSGTDGPAQSTSRRASVEQQMNNETPTQGDRASESASHDAPGQFQGPGNYRVNEAAAEASTTETMAQELEQALGHQIRLYNQLTSSSQPTPPVEENSQSMHRRAPSWESREPEVISWRQEHNVQDQQATAEQNATASGTIGAQHLSGQTEAYSHDQQSPPIPPKGSWNATEQQAAAAMPSYAYQYESDAASSIQPSPHPQEAVLNQAHASNAYQQQVTRAAQPPTSLYDGADYGGQYQGGNHFSAYQPDQAAYNGPGYAYQHEQMPGQQQPQYNNQWYQSYNGYYGEQQSQHQQQQQQQQQQRYDGNGYVSASQHWSQQQTTQSTSTPPPHQFQQLSPQQRPEIKPQRSSFFGMKDTFTKAMGGKGSWS